MNPITGEKIIDIGGQKYTLKFTWKALSEIQQTHGDNPNLFNAEVVAAVAASGFRDRHPELTAEKIMDLAPPLMPFAYTVQAALQWAYFGAEAIPKDDVKKKIRVTGFLRRIGQRLKRGFLLLSFGA